MKDGIRGKGAVGIAIAYYGLKGLVSIPLIAGEYNILFDDYTKIKRIKVISCSYKTKYGVYSASIRSSGGNQPNTSVKLFDPKSCDYVFIVTENLDLYEIPADEVTSKRQISLDAYMRFKVKLIPD